MTIAICIPSFDGRHLLEATLPSVITQTLGADRIVVVDNGSTDGTLSWLAQSYPDIQVVRHPRNRGIASALNSCLEAAEDMDYVALFNNDVELAPDAIEKLAAVLDGQPDISAVGPKMVNYYDRTILDGTGDIYCRLGTACRRGHAEPDRGQYNLPGSTFGVCAGAGMYRTSAIREIGAFDERFFACYEDVDWAVRANLAGHRCWYEPSSVVFHMSSATVGAGLNTFTGYHCWRNAIWVVAKNWPRRDILVFGWALLAGQLANVAVAARYGMLRVLLSAWRDAARSLPAILRARSSNPPARAPLRIPLVVLQLNWLRARPDDQRRRSHP